MEAICSIREDIGREISRDTPKIPSNECQPWQEEVKRIVTEMNLIKEEFNENRRCLNGCCFPDICSCKKIVTMLDVVAEHQDASVFKGSMLVDALPVVVENVPLPLIKWGETAIDRYVQQIIQSLRGAKTREIRLWGMGGVGKTTLKSLNILLEIVQTFQVVLWVTVSKDWTVRKVQHEIAERLKIDIQDGKSNEFMVRRLLEKLSTMKYLLLLGDLWSLMNLEDVRVPLQNREIGNMETDEEIKVRRPVLRRSMEPVSRKSSIEPIAKDVVKECAGLPVVVIGKSLRKVDDFHVWQDALNQLRWTTFKFGDTENGLFERLKLSYDRLEDVEKKSRWEGLSSDEAWNLFREKVCDVLDSPSIEPIAQDVVKECAGLPVVVIGKSLWKVDDFHVWQDALNQLRWTTMDYVQVR